MRSLGIIIISITLLRITAIINWLGAVIHRRNKTQVRTTVVLPRLLLISNASIYGTHKVVSLVIGLVHLLCGGSSAGHALGVASSVVSSRLSAACLQQRSR